MTHRAGAPLLSLLHLCDSLFPTGGFAHSDGLEAAVDRGHVSTADDLALWLDAMLDHAIGRTEAPAVLGAFDAFTARNPEAIAAVDDEVYAMRPAAVARLATRGIGGRLLRTWRTAYRSPAIQEILPDAIQDHLTFPVAFGVACAAAGVDPADTLEGYAYSRLASSVSAAMRLMPLGQHRAHQLLAATLVRVPRVAAAVVERRAAPRSFAPLMDIVSMQHQHVRSTLFRS